MPEVRQPARALREYALHALLLAALLVPVFPNVFLRGEVAISANALYDLPPWREYAPAGLRPQNVNLETPRQAVSWYYLTDRAMDDGEWPLWNPYQFTGVPLLGAYQTAIFYPPRLMFRLFENLYAAITTFILFKLWLAGFLAFCCARGLSLTIAAARFYSIAYMLSGYMVTACSYTTVDSMAWAPILFLGIEYIIGGRFLRGYAVSLVSSSMMLLAAGAQHTLTFSIVLGVYFAARLLGNGSLPNAIRSSAVALAAAATCMLVAAIQVLPFVEYRSQSLTSLECFFEEVPTDYRYSLYDLPTLWSALYFGTYLHANFWGNLNHFFLKLTYLGLPCWLGASLCSMTKGIQKTRAVCMILACLVAFWQAFDGFGASLASNLPVLDGVRPSYYITFAVFAIPLVAATGFQAWFMENGQRRWPWQAIAMAIVIAGTVCIHLAFSQGTLADLNAKLERTGSLVAPLIGLALPRLPYDGTLADFVLRQVVWTLELLALTIICIVTAHVFRRNVRFGMPAVTAVLVTDLVAACYGMQQTSPLSQVFPSVPELRAMQQLGHPNRIDFDAIAVDGLPIPYGLEELQGYDAFIPARFWRTFRSHVSPRGQRALERVAATPYYFFSAAHDPKSSMPGEMEVVDESGGVVIARDHGALPRARLVGNTIRCASLEEVLAAVDAPEFDPGITAPVEGLHAPELRSGSSEPPGRASISEWSWNNVAVETDARTDAVLVLAEAYYPGWEAWIDGKQRAEIFPVYHVFRGVSLPAGKHTVTFRYRPLSFRIGAGISVVALCALLVCALLLILRPRRGTGVRE